MDVSALAADKTEMKGIRGTDASALSAGLCEMNSMTGTDVNAGFADAYGKDIINGIKRNAYV